MAAFTVITQGQQITADGTYSVSSHSPGLDLIVELGGSAGTGTVTVGYCTIDSQFQAYPSVSDPAADMTLASGMAARVLSTFRGFVLLKLAGSTNPTLTCAVYPVRVTQNN